MTNLILDLAMRTTVSYRDVRRQWLLRSPASAIDLSVNVFGDGATMSTEAGEQMARGIALDRSSICSGAPDSARVRTRSRSTARCRYVQAVDALINYSTVADDVDRFIGSPGYLGTTTRGSVFAELEHHRRPSALALPDGAQRIVRCRRR